MPEGSVDLNAPDVHAFYNAMDAGEMHPPLHARCPYTSPLHAPCLSTSTRLSTSSPMYSLYFLTTALLRPAVRRDLSLHLCRALRVPRQDLHNARGVVERGEGVRVARPAARDARGGDRRAVSDREGGGERAEGASAQREPEDDHLRRHRPVARDAGGGRISAGQNGMGKALMATREALMAAAAGC